MPSSFPIPPLSAGFAKRGAWVIARLMTDLGITDIQAAGIVGNLGGESGLQAVPEQRPLAGRGGFGWEQATGDRRVNFERFCASCGLPVTDDEANYRFLLQELRGPEAHALKQLRKCTGARAATETFCVYFERPAKTDDDEITRRYGFAAAALAEYRVRPPDVPAPDYWQAEHPWLARIAGLFGLGRR